MAHFDVKSEHPTYCTLEYGPLALLDFMPNCTHLCSFRAQKGIYG